MARDWVEMHPSQEDANIYDGIAEFSNAHDRVPEATPASGIFYLETTNRVDGPWAGRQYVRGTDSMQDTPAPPAPPPPDPDIAKLEQMEADDLAADAAIETLLGKVNSNWTDTDRSSAQKISLRKLHIETLRRRVQ